MPSRPSPPPLTVAAHAAAATVRRGRRPAAPPSFEEAASMPSPAAVEGQVSTLVSMGFTRAAALDALHQSQYDMSAAANLLLSQS